MTTLPPSSSPHQWRRVKAASLASATAVVAVAIGLTVWIAPPARAMSSLAAPYTAGCQGQSSRANTPVKVGVGSDSGASVSLTTGVVKDGTLSQYPTSGVNSFTGGTTTTSEYEGGGIFWVGCSSPTSNTYGETASWTWEVTVYPWLSLSCASGETAFASYSVTLFADVHTGASPYYAIYPNFVTQPAASYQLYCSGSGSPTYAPSSPITATYTLTTPPFQELSVNSYDFQSSVYADAYSTESGNGFAESTVAFTATLTSVTCSGCA